MTVSYDSTMEARLLALEDRVHYLLRWQKVIEAASAVAFATSQELLTHDVIYEEIKNREESPKRAHNLRSSTDSTKITELKELKQQVKSVRAFRSTKENLPAHVVAPKESIVDITATQQDLKPVNPVHEIPLPVEKPSTVLALNILDVIQSYGQHLDVQSDSLAGKAWAGKSMFVGGVETQVESHHPIRMILPSFPWKSINRVDKVIGHLPDLGEELALARLNSLCKDIEKIYPAGAEVTIATDGLVFDDLVGILDEDTWTYSESLMELATQKGFTNIKLIRVMDLLALTDGQKMTKDSYLALTPAARKTLEEQYGRTEEEVLNMIQTDADTLLTYRGFIRFLETDLKHSHIAQQAPSGRQFRKCVKKVAMGMMIRAESFTKLLRAKCPGYVRLSIHPSSGAVKLSIPLIPQASGEFPRSPWHCSIAVGIDGSYRTVHAKEVRDTHKLIYRNDRPYYYRERSELWDWDDDKVEFEPQYPGGVLVHPRAGLEGRMELTAAQLDKLRQLAELQSPVTVSGFANLADAVFPASA